MREGGGSFRPNTEETVINIRLDGSFLWKGIFRRKDQRIIIVILSTSSSLVTDEKTLTPTPPQSHITLLPRFWCKPTHIIHDTYDITPQHSHSFSSQADQQKGFVFWGKNSGKMETSSWFFQELDKWQVLEKFSFRLKQLCSCVVAQVLHM